MKTQHRRRLPHIQPIGATFFVTINLEGAIPKDRLEALKRARDQAIREIRRKPDLRETEKNRKVFEAKRAFFKKYDSCLDKPEAGSPRWLEQPGIARLVMDKFHEYNGTYYDLLACCIMSNHVHVLFGFSVQLPVDGSPVDEKKYKQLWQVMKLIGGGSATLANRILGRVGQSFWQEEYFDRYIRNEMHLANAFSYTIMNPVKAGICKDWRDYPFTWAKEGGNHSNSIIF